MSASISSPSARRISWAWLIPLSFVFTISAVVLVFVFMPLKGVVIEDPRLAAGLTLGASAAATIKAAIVIGLLRKGVLK